MKRLVVICEGQTEQEFCKSVLYPHFLNRGILLQHPTIKRSRGGIVSWPKLVPEIELILKRDRSVIVSTLFDYYGIRGKHRFPSWENSKKIPSRPDRMSFLESEMKSNIISGSQHRFIPYLQLHEFEGLLFVDPAAFRQTFEDDELLDFEELEKIIRDNPNPELINDGEKTAPSKRLLRLVKGYNKVTDGSNIAMEIGLPKIRLCCPRFNAWITTLENI